MMRRETHKTYHSWKRSFVMLMLLLLSLLTVSAQEYAFRHYGVNDGMPSQHINCSMQDSRGFMWFGTDLGLVYYDGALFRSSIPFIDAASPLKGTSVTCLAQDADGLIWIGTTKGIYTYDIEHDRLDCPAPNGWDMNDVRGLAFDAQGAVWVRTGWAFYRLDFKHGDFRQYMPDRYFLPTDFILTRSGVMWVLSLEGIIYSFDPKSDTFTPFRIIPEDADGRVKLLAKAIEREDGKLVILTTQGGARLFSPTTKKVDTLFTAFDHETPAITHTMMKRTEDEYWFATEHGIYIWKTDEGSEGSMTHLQKNAGNARSLSDNAVHTLCQDKEGGIWIGTWFGGVNYLSSVHNSFRHISLTDGQGRVESSVARSIIPDGDTSLWIGAEDGGLYRYDIPAETMRSFNHLTWQGQRLPANVQSLMLVDGKLWIGSFDGNIYVYDAGQDRITDRMHLPYSFSTDMCTTHDGHIYIATAVALLECKATTESGRYAFERVEEVPAGAVHHLYEDSDGKLWASTLGHGVWRQRATKDGLHWEKVDMEEAYVYTTFVDSRGMVWNGTAFKGLYGYDPSVGKALTVPVTLHQLGMCVYRIVEDNRGILWCTTNNGLYSYDRTTDNVVRYGLPAVLSSPQFSLNSGYMDNDGKIYFGSLDGILSFNPEKVEPPMADLRVYFTDYINEGTSFGLCFSVPVYSIQETLWFRYRLKGVDKDWTVIQGQRNIRYSNLPYGHYTLEVESSLQNGNWTGCVSVLPIEVVAPWYATALAKWFYALCVLAVCLLVFLRYRNRQRERQQQEMERQRVEREKELSQEKMKFFTAITHEIRTPLTLIMTPVKSLIGNFSPERAQLMLPTIYRNASELLNLVNQILDYRKLEQGRTRLELSHGDFNEFCKTVMDLFSEMAEKKHIDFSTNISTPLYMNFDKEKMQRVVVNLLSNAFKFTPENGRIRLESHVVGRQCILTVSDTGVGISQKDIPHVFDLFYQSRDNKDPGLEQQISVGSGIGLHLVREFVGMHSGQVTVESRHDATDGPTGTTFTLVLPTDLHLSVGPDPQDSDDESEDADDTQQGEYPFTTEEEATGLVPVHKPTILLVDDNEELRQYLYLELSDEYDILQASNGQEGLALALEHEVEIVVSDVMMPVMDGMELCRSLKDNVKTSHLFVILLTAKVGEQYRLTGYKSGADYYIAKPFNIEILRDRIAYLHKLRQQRHDRFLQDVEITPKELTNSQLDEELYNKAVRFIHNNMSNEDYGVEQFGADMCMSRMTLYRKIQNITGQRPLEFIRAIRLKRAATLLKTTDHSVLEIAEMVGFGTPRNFSKNFKLLYGMSPSEYKKGAPSSPESESTPPPSEEEQ